LASAITASTRTSALASFSASYHNCSITDWEAAIQHFVSREHGDHSKSSFHLCTNPKTPCQNGVGLMFQSIYVTINLS
jgi:hypothetical protein